MDADEVDRPAEGGPQGVGEPTVAQQLLRICPATAHIPVISCSTQRSIFVERDPGASLAEPERLLAAVQRQIDLQAH